MSERGPEGVGFNESLSRSFKLAEKFRKAGVLGEKSDQESKNKDNEVVREILSSSFPLHYQNENQYDSVPQYESVTDMILVSRDSGKTDAVRNRAENALFEIGLALSQNKEVLEMATEGEDELNKVTPSRLHEIYPYILSTVLTNGKDDKQGQEMVYELVDLFKLKKKASEKPEFYEDDFKSASKKFYDKLYDKREDLDSKAIANGTESIIEKMMGYVSGMSETKNGSAEEKNNKKGDVDIDNLNETVKGMNDFLNKIGGHSNESRENKVNRSRSGVEIKYRNEDFPDTEKEQLEFIEERLNIIENYPTKSIKGELALGDFTYPLFTMLAKEEAPEHILNIINTRLTLKEMGNRLGANSGFMGDHGEGMPRCIADLEADGFDMSPQVMEYFFMDKINGLRTAEAWDLMELANFEYQKTVDEAAEKGSEKIQKMIRENYPEGKEKFCELKPLVFSEGTPLEGQVYNYWFEGQGKNPRAKIVKEYLIEKLLKDAEKEGKILTEKQARKSMQLAEFMFDATGESSVMNWDFINGDEYSELINIGYIRNVDGSSGNKGKLVGPKISKRQIKHLTPGWVRSFSKENDPTKPIMSKTIIEKGLSGKDKGLIGKKLYSTHFISVISKKVWPARRIILNEETPLQKDVLKTTYFQGVNDYFNKVDSEVGRKGVTKTAWLAGLVELSLTGRDSMWSKNDYTRLKEIVTKDIITEEGTDNAKSFITEEQWNWIEKSLDLNKMAGKIDRRNIVSRFLNGAKK